MATLVFGALGSLVGGPVGGAFGALLGRTVDRQIIGTPARQGPRLTELAVSSSSYGQPIARQFGAMRVAGTIVWATDLVEARGTQGGGKGAPRTTTYSYSVSLAVALSSRPIERVGRIWADGNLLRGVAGDLKTGGTLRVHRGHGDQPPDPLLAAALGARCPAHRGTAYVVFEDLQLADFGNRIPALGFEVFADGAGEGLAASLLETNQNARASVVHSAGPITGFSLEGGSLGDVFAMLTESVPLVIGQDASGVVVGNLGLDMQPLPLSEPVAWDDGDFGTRTGTNRARRASRPAGALRYYDSGRDYQPGLQRAGGRAPAGAGTVIELPAAMTADGARSLISASTHRDAVAADTMAVRLVALDPAIGPGSLVSFAEEDGAWIVREWEWRDGGVELRLERQRSTAPTAAVPAADPGLSWRPRDRPAARTRITAFEVPWDGTGAADIARIHVAVSKSAGRWPGAELFVERNGALVSQGGTGPVAALAGVLIRPLGPSPSLVFERAATLDLMADDPDADWPSADEYALASGANRLLVGGEILQFAQALPFGEGRWRLGGLMRGRGATEAEAAQGHAAGSPIVLLDARLMVLGGDTLDPFTERLAAIGLAESEPVFSRVQDPGRSRSPLPPVHPRAKFQADGGLVLSWTRRARGAWNWSDVDVPLMEEVEAYEVGAGDTFSPLQVWLTDIPTLTLSAAQIVGLPPATPLWVRQSGTFARSPEIVLARTPD